ncbi:MAG TPA: AraC family transcriptional regulator [Opitutaceae bacterium]
MSSQFRLSRLLARKLPEAGLSPTAVLRHARLPPDLFEQENILLSTDELFAFWKAIMALSARPGIGLVLGSEERIERYDPIAITAISTPTFREALNRIVRYKQLTCPEEIRLTGRNDECIVSFEWPLANEAVPAALLDCCFAWMLGIGRRGMARPLAPVRLELRRTPDVADVYQAHFGCPIVFNAVRDAIVFRLRDLETPFVTHNPDLLRLIAPQLEAEWALRAAQSRLGERVKTILKRGMAGRRPDIREVGRELSVSVRTLQRRLADEQVTFQQLLTEARRELAHHYLLHSSLQLSELAFLLGYEDMTSFLRAFQSWEGLSPSRWREDRKGRLENASLDEHYAPPPLPATA